MNHEVKFRSYRLDTGEWTYGYIVVKGVYHEGAKTTFVSVKAGAAGDGLHDYTSAFQAAMNAALVTGDEKTDDQSDETS